MAYNPHNLSVLGYANGFTLWHYCTTDTADQVDSTGYFSQAVEMLRVGDMMMANCDTDGTPAAGIFLVARSSAGVVDVANLTRVGADNTD
ncbi:hypothetical protein [Defluviicoccus vanus]|uniref:Uncharacterized protein n=1 Tax=Defluviicoccus vanus TaxID=111831 RepID=A0A7H1N1R3_9PROT|nr:hypothetical protein [Defluviicoccus vanus]QNT69649.1 hypothetical protein HQ394_10345 [Defluviicoccus vanus]